MFRAFAKVRASGVISDTLRAYANGCKDDWDNQLPLAEFVINSAASTLDDGHTPFVIDLGAHPCAAVVPPPVLAVAVAPLLAPAGFWGAV